MGGQLIFALLSPFFLCLLPCSRPPASPGLFPNTLLHSSSCLGSAEGGASLSGPLIGTGATVDGNRRRDLHWPS